MTETPDIAARIEGVRALIYEKTGAGGASLDRAMKRARHQVPRRIAKQAAKLAAVEPLARHPKLRLTLDTVALDRMLDEVEAHFEAIDLADRRKGWFLGMLGGLSFNLILAFVLLISILVWQGVL